MVKRVKLIRIGGSVGMTIPRELLQRLGVDEGDTLHVVASKDGVMLTPYDPEFEAAVEAYEHVAKKHRDVFRALASR